MRAGSLTLLAFATACGSDAVSGGPDGGSPGMTGPVGDDAGSAVHDGGADGPAPVGDGGPDHGPFPLGATWGNDAVHFRVRADPATAVELDVYAKTTGAD